MINPWQFHEMPRVIADRSACHTDRPQIRRDQDISSALNRLLADMFALYIKTKNFHGHISRARIFAITI